MADSDIQKIKDRVNIVDVVSQYVQLRRAGRNYSARCPFHKEKTPSFYVNPERGTYMCFGCGEKGDIFSFVEKIDGVDFVTALKQLAEKAGVTLTSRGPVRSPEEVSIEKEKNERLKEVCEASVQFFENELTKRSETRDYLHTRGLTDETIHNWRIGYAPASWDELSRHLVGKGFAKKDIIEAGFAVAKAGESNPPVRIFDRFRGRIMFPIFDNAGVPIAVSGRFFEKVPGARDETEPAKYVNSPETELFKKSRTLYGLTQARGAIRKADCILLVEGQFDLLLCHQSGLPCTVALSGTALTPEHLHLLGRISKRLVLALDADQAGLRAGLRSTHLALQAGFDVKIPTFPESKDPADVGRENPELLKAAVRTSKAAIEFFLDAFKPQAKDLRAYQKLVEVQVVPLVSVLQSAIEREHFISLIARKLGVVEAAVRFEVNKPRPKVSFMINTSEEASVHNTVKVETTLDPLTKKIGMVLFAFPVDSEERAALTLLVGEDRLHIVTTELAHHEEMLRFSFEREVGEHSSPQVIAKDMLGDIERVITKERVKMRFM